MSQLTVNTRFESVRDEWQQNARLRIGVYIVFGIFWLYAILLLRDAVVREGEAWQSAESRNARARATATSADWVTRAQDVAGSINEHEMLLWREGSIGLSQAAFQERITQSFASENIVVRSSPRVATPDSPVNAGLTDVLPLRARVQIDFRPASFYPWLAGLNKTRTEKRATIVIDTLTIRAGSFGQPSTADIELVGYVLKGAASAANASGSPVEAPASTQAKTSPINAPGKPLDPSANKQGAGK